MRTSRGGSSGFTLIETLVAITLSSVVMLALFGMFSGVVDVVSHVRKQENVSYGQSIFRSLLMDDLRSIYLGSQEDFRFKGGSGSFLGIDGGFLEFATSASLNTVGGEVTTSLKRVQYTLVRGERGSDIVRRERAYCGVKGDWEWVEAVVFRGVEELELEYLDPEDWSYSTEWDKPEASCPRAVSVHVECADEREFSFVVELSAISDPARGAQQ
jgi:type II secretion system protein J